MKNQNVPTEAEQKEIEQTAKEVNDALLKEIRNN